MQLGIVGIGVAMDRARIVVWIVTAGEHTGRPIVGIDAFVRAFEIVFRVARFVADQAAGGDQGFAALGRRVRYEIVTREVGDVVRVFAARLELAGFDRRFELALEGSSYTPQGPEQCASYG